jgi:Ras-related protein Rab-8A
MYDCTYEKSFLNVKDWLSTIDESSDKQIPIIIIGNKTDLRDEIRKQRRVVEYADGLKLAKVNSLF